MSPHRSLSTEPPPGSKSAPRDRSTPPNPPSEDPGFTESKQFCAQDPGSENPSEGIDPEATEPFPPDLFRVPVPNRVFSEMPSMGDAALRCLLALIHRSFRFDPQSSEWTCPEKQFSRREIEAATGLSDQGTRNGLAELEEIGYAEIDRSGRSYSYALRMEVPSRRYTYVPTALLEKASEFSTGATLRAVLAVLRATWGWTSKCTPKEKGSGERGSQTVHKRWAELSMPTLAGIAGRSEPAVRRAAKALEGTWISRVRPGEGAHHYRILPGALSPGSEDGKKRTVQEGTVQEENVSSKTPTANESSPERQQTYPPASYKKSSSKDKQTQKSESKPSTDTEQNRSETSDSGSAVPASPNQTENQPGNQPGGQPKENSDPDFSDLPEQKQSLAQKLVNAGVWPDRVRECLRRYSAPRVAANFKLWRTRKNDPEAPEIKNDGAWLCMAITDGYANLSSEHSSSEDSSPRQGPRRGSHTNSGSSPPDGPSARGSSETSSRPRKPSHKQRVSPQEKDALIRHYEKITSDQFHRFRHGKSPTENQFLYFKPEKGGPSPRRPAGQHPPPELTE
jgi:hypothetical protein